MRLVLPLTVLTLGLAPLALNAAMVPSWRGPSTASRLDGFWWGIGVTAIVTAVSMSLTALLALDDDAVVLRHLAPPPLARQAARTRQPTTTDPRA